VFSDYGDDSVAQLGGELVEEEALERPAVARVAREQGALDHLGEAGERERVTVRVGHVAAEQLAFFGRERHVGHGSLGSGRSGAVGLMRAGAVRRGVSRA
jgi:hypothetical protein